MQYKRNLKFGQVRSEVMPPLPHLRAWRQVRNLTQDQLAERAGVQQSTLYRIEALGKNAHGVTVRALAAALDISPDELVGRSPSDVPLLRKRIRHPKERGGAGASSPPDDVGEETPDVP